MTGAQRLLPTDLSGPDLAEHLRCHGPMPALTSAAVRRELEASGLTGRGGARFPVARKVSAVAAGRGPAVVVGNGAEGEPASRKDRTLLTRAPHLVLDGLAVATVAVKAHRAVLYLPAGDATEAVRRALTQRKDRLPVTIVEAPDTFLSGQETAVVQRINGRAALPRDPSVPVYQRGVDGRPTLVQNVETLAHLGLLVRRGAAGFREVGTQDEPGTMLVTVSGDVRLPGVYEVPLGASLTRTLRTAGGAPDLRAVLIGGYHGAWVPTALVTGLELSHAALAPHDATPGAGVLLALGQHRCPLQEAATITEYLAQQSARQCGPCLNGLPALAATMRRLAGSRATMADVERLQVLQRLVTGRGACKHPDGSVRFVRSSLSVFAEDVRAHLSGTCQIGRAA